MSWFTPKCPVDKETREWIENAFGWLIEELGIDVLRNAEVVLPTEEHFPDAFDGSRASIRKMVDRLCEYMDVDPGLVEVRFYENEDDSRFHPLAAEGSTRSHALGTYQKGRDGKYAISLELHRRLRIRRRWSRPSPTNSDTSFSLAKTASTRTIPITSL